MIAIKFNVGSQMSSNGENSQYLINTHVITLKSFSYNIKYKINAVGIRSQVFCLARISFEIG